MILTDNLYDYQIINKVQFYIIINLLTDGYIWGNPYDKIRKYDKDT